MSNYILFHFLIAMDQRFFKWLPDSRNIHHILPLGT